MLCSLFLSINRAWDEGEILLQTKQLNTSQYPDTLTHTFTPATNRTANCCTDTLSSLSQYSQSHLQGFTLSPVNCLLNI